jgi:hypothetical protein
MRSLGATAPSLPKADAGTTNGAAIVAPTVAAPYWRNFRRGNADFNNKAGSFYFEPVPEPCRDPRGVDA